MKNIRSMWGRVATIKANIRKNRIAYYLLIPALICMVLVHFIPMIWGFTISFLDFDIHAINDWSKATFIGIDNYIEGLNPITTIGERFLRSLWNVALYAIVVISVGYLIAMGVALLLNQNFKGRTIVRGLILLPYIIPDTVAFSVWRFIFQSRIGIVNKYLLALGWIREPTLWLIGDKAIYAVMIASIWKGWPFTCLILLAGLQSIPNELYEAAKIDGASAWHQFKYITFPLLIPMTTVLILLSTIWTFYAFNQFYVMLGADPGYQSDVPATLILREAFTSLHYGIGSAMSVILMVIMTVFAILYIKKILPGEGVV
jgi:multiple sugar transport system permease protein